MTQRELPGASARWHSENPGATCSGGRLADFKEGWAIFIFGAGGVAHYYERTQASQSVIADQLDDARSLCGREAPVRGLYGAGNYPKCERCIVRLQKKVFGGAR